jgi:hypothetical protein
MGFIVKVKFSGGGPVKTFASRIRSHSVLHSLQCT